MRRLRHLYVLPVFYAVVLLIALSACNKEVAVQDTTSEEKSAQGFNFENKVDMNLSLSFKDRAANPNSEVYISIFFENPYLESGLGLNKDLVPSIKGKTDKNGVFATQLSVPGHISKFYAVVSDYITYHECIEIPKSTTYSNTIYPIGFGVLKSPASTRGAFDPVAYTRRAVPMLNESLPSITGTETNLWVLGSYNATNGLPNFLTTNQVSSSGLSSRISSALPAGVNQYALNSTTHYFDNQMLSNINLTEAGNVWVTFLGEGAGCYNTFGYFYYPTNTPPTTPAQINKRIIVYPNSSANGSGGALVDGNRVKLLYYNESAGTWGDLFPAGYTIGWFVVTGGWGGQFDSYFANTTKWQYSLYTLNSGAKPQSIILYDRTSNSLVLSFEDSSVEDGTGNASNGRYPSDKDYNDLSFVMTWNPPTVVDNTIYPKVPNNSDTDHDGVIDTYDDYPTDPERAYDNFYPGAAQFGSLAFEDNWPQEGDYDFNDLVLAYQVKYVTNAAGNVKDVVLRSRVEAIGADYRNGFAWEINASPSNVASVTTSYSGPGTLLGNALFPLDAKGYEAGQTKVVIPFFDNAFTSFGSSYIANYPNTISGGATYSSSLISKTVTFTTPVTLASLGSLPYNPFIVVNQERGREVHKAGQHGTTKANTSYYGTAADRTNQSNLWYVGTNQEPWAIETPTTFEYPAAGNHIKTTYLKMSDWATSNGSSFTDWYSNTGSGYRNTVKIYKKN